MEADFPRERWFWFEPGFHNGQSALLHKQPDDIWRIDLIDDPPAKVEAMQIQLKPGAMPFVCKARKYTSGDSEYMKLFNENLAKNKLVFISD